LDIWDVCGRVARRRGGGTRPGEKALERRQHSAIYCSLPWRRDHAGRR
jgi:hypothetical protein